MKTNTTYRRLTMDEREEISRLLATGTSQAGIARTLGRSPGTVSREIAGRGMTAATYRAQSADWRSAQARKKQGAKRKMERYPALRAYVHEKLRKRWSPEQISKHLTEEYPDDMTMQISPETIYTYIYVLPRGQLKQELVKALRQKRKRRGQRKRLRGTEQETRGKLADILSIEERPKEVADRTVPGHWEGDLILGKYKRTALGTLVERTTRFVILVPLKTKDAPGVRTAFAGKMKQLPSYVRKTLTYDQGKEMSQHKLFSKGTRMKVYFAHPGSPWERGTNENTNGLLRQYFPKGTDFSTLSSQKIRAVQDELNGRPRKTLNWKTPQEKMNELLR
ncbi:MAG: IS30 family transposase [Candidatus Kerfeldbacteria bacterium]